MYQFELIRIVGMFMIVLHHVTVHGHYGENMGIYSFNIELFYPQALSIFGKVGVILYTMVSGYFLIEKQPQLKRLGSIIWPTLFYLSLGFILSVRGLWKMDALDLSTFWEVLWNSYYPFSGYWFVNSYIVLYFFIPYINQVLITLEKKDFEKLLVKLLFILSIFFLLTTDYAPLGGLGNLLMGYTLGAYLKRFPLKLKTRQICFGLIGSIGLTVLFIYITDLFPPTEAGLLMRIINSPLIIAYDNSLMMVLIGFFAFLLLARVQIKNSFIQKTLLILGNSMFGVYLLHDNRVIGDRIMVYLAQFLQDTSVVIVPIIIVLAIGLFVLCTVFESVRQYCAKRFFNIIGRKKV
ncbi:acyltransferase family protein [Enterococcus sp. LJL90]